MKRIQRGKTVLKNLVTPSEPSFCSDDVLVDVYNALTRDFQRQRMMGRPQFVGSVREYRELRFPPLADVLDIPSYKAIYQLKNLFSRYTATDDIITSEQRVSNTMLKYEENLIHVNTARYYDSPLLRPVIRVARRKIREILGILDIAEVFDLARFGRRASVGVPYLESYIDRKMDPSATRSPWGAETLWSLAITGDPVLKAYLKYRKILKDKEPGKTRRDPPIYVDRLRLSLVAKKFDKLRGVMPYPTVDTYLSLGIGGVMVQRLMEHGLDLSRAQSLHRWLVAKMSVDRKSVTMDLSGASDCITRQLVRLLLPCKWWALLKKFYFKKVVTPDGRVVHTETFAGMGCGFTFPLQTLIFYCLIEAVKELVPVTGKTYVYGDDCIFPTRAYPYVERVFEGLGLKINRDKTFVTRYFRESCGEDCYRGTSVRPFQPEGSTVELSGTAGSAYLYKLLNGLLSRWKRTDIPNTVFVLLKRISMHSGKIYLVPPFLADTAGYKVGFPDWEDDLWYMPFVRPVVYYPTGARGIPKWKTPGPSQWDPIYCYKALGAQPNRRLVEWSYPYLWEHLRSLKHPKEEAWNPYLDPNDDPKIIGYAPDEEGNTHPFVARKGSTHYIDQVKTGLWVKQVISVR